MTFPRKYNVVAINVMLAVVISLVINFSYLLAIREQDKRDFGAPHMENDREEGSPHRGVLHVSKDGYGYILCEDHPDGHTDSIYVSAGPIRRLNLNEGSVLTVVARDSHYPEGNPLMWRVLEIDGVSFDYGSLYNRPGNNLVMGLQFGFYLLYAFLLLSIMTAGANRNVTIGFYLTRAAYCLIVAVALYWLLPAVRPRSGEVIITAMNFSRGKFMLDPIGLMKCSFILVFALLYGRTYQLIYQKEDVMLENEQLKNENLKARYNTLINQINPHFLFNSLNSLSSLVREGKNDDAVTYIDRLSDTFRYTIQNEPHTTTTLYDELEFVNAYKYLLEIRYDEKLFIDINVEESKLDWILPTFSVQPLIENAVKHNTITRSKPLHISIRTDGTHLVVSNPVNPKISPEKSTGIGLDNLSKRWQLLTGKNIHVTNDGKTFSVRLPFINTKP